MAVLLFVLLAASAGAAPRADWRVSTPQAQGLDASVLKGIDRDIAARMYGRIDGLLIIRHGVIAFERAYSRNYRSDARGEAPGQYNYHDPMWHPYYKMGPLHTLQSITKGVTSTLIGIAIGRGELPDVNVEVKQYFKGPRPADGMTLEHLLTMRSGIRWDEESDYSDPKCDWAALERQADWIRFILEKPMAAAPGAQFVYSSGDAVLLDQVLWAATGKHADAYAAEYLFAPLGIESYYWKTTATGTADTQGGLYLSGRDLAKIGFLYIRDGKWNDRRILPEGWVAATMSPHKIADDDDWKYGYHWWLIPYAGGKQKYAWTLLGYGGQRLVVVPEYDLIVVQTAWNIDGKPPQPKTSIVDRVVAAVR